MPGPCSKLCEHPRKGAHSCSSELDTVLSSLRRRCRVPWSAAWLKGLAWVPGAGARRLLCLVTSLL